MALEGSIFLRKCQGHYLFSYGRAFFSYGVGRRYIFGKFKAGERISSARFG